MSKIRVGIAGLSLALLGGVFASRADVDHFKEGQRLFGEQNFAGALEEFQKADLIVPDEPTITSWIGASLNALGKYTEAKQRIEKAFKLLQDEQRQLQAARQPVPPIAVGLYVLMAEVQVNLLDFEGAVNTIQTYELPANPSDGAAEAKQNFETAQKTVLSRLVTAGVQCLNAGDLDCARTALKQADRLDPAPPTVIEAVARDAMSRAAKAPATTDEEKAKKAELYNSAITAVRLWISDSEPKSVDAQRMLVRALVATKTPEGYEEARRILTTLWEGAADPAQKDPSIQLDLAAIYTVQENWEQVITSASTAIQSSTDDDVGEAYCKRSYAQYRLGNCRQAIEDGQRCKNQDGTPRSLRHVDTCNQRLALEARVAADHEASIQRECEYLQQTVQWAIESGDIGLEELLKVIRDFEARKGKCAPYFSAAARADTATALCHAGVQAASSPLNLSSRSREQLQALRAQIQDYSSLCKPALNPTQTASIQGGIQKVDQALSMYR